MRSATEGARGPRAHGRVPESSPSAPPFIDGRHRGEETIERKPSADRPLARTRRPARGAGRRRYNCAEQSLHPLAQFERRCGRCRCLLLLIGRASPTGTRPPGIGRGIGQHDDGTAGVVGRRVRMVGRPDEHDGFGIFPSNGAAVFAGDLGEGGDRIVESGRPEYGVGGAPLQNPVDEVGGRHGGPDATVRGGPLPSFNQRAGSPRIGRRSCFWRFERGRPDRGSPEIESGLGPSDGRSISACVRNESVTPVYRRRQASAASAIMVARVSGFRSASIVRWASL